MNKQRDKIHDLLVELADYGDDAINHVDRIETEIERIVSEYVAWIIGEDLDPKHAPYEYATTLSINRFIAEQRKAAARYFGQEEA